MCNRSALSPDKVVATILLPVFAGATVTGNLLVIAAVCLKHYLRSSTNAMVASLAVADLIVGVIVMPPNIIQEVLGMWIFGRRFCDLWRAFDVLASTSSIWNLCLLSIDRYLGVKDAFLYPVKVTPIRTVIAIGVVWISSFLIAFPAAIWWDGRNQSPDLNATQCDTCEFGQDVAYNTFSSLMSFYIPMGVMLFAYYHVFRVAVRYRRSLSEGRLRMKGKGTMRVHRGSRPFGSVHDLRPTSLVYMRGGTQSLNSSDSRNCSLAFESFSEPGRGEEERNRGRVASRFARFFAEQRAARTLGIVVGCFVACWLPFFVLNVLYALCHTCIRHADIVMTSATWLGHCNSFFNPLIYAFFNDGFQRAFRSLLTCRPSRRQSASQDLLYNSCH